VDDELSPREIKRRFRRRVRLNLGVGILAGLFAVGAMIVGSDLPAGAFLGAIGAVAVVVIATSAIFWRCPACDGSLGQYVYPRRCPRCDAVLHD